MKIMKLTWWFN